MSVTWPNVVYWTMKSGENFRYRNAFPLENLQISSFLMRSLQVVIHIENNGYKGDILIGVTVRCQRYGVNQGVFWNFDRLTLINATRGRLWYKAKLTNDAVASDANRGVNFAVFAALSIGSRKRKEGQNFWKFNNTVITNADIRREDRALNAA